MEADMKRKHTVEGVADRGKIEFAREQRKNPTRAEQMLWEAVRRKQLGVRIRRQHPIEDFVLDFYCAEARLAVEIDGPVHDKQQGYDRWREQQLARWGIHVIRVDEERVRRDLPAVIKEIRKALSDRLREGPSSRSSLCRGGRRPSPGPSPCRGGE